MAFVGGGRVPPSQPQTAVNIDEELFDDDLDEEFYDDDPQVLTGVSRQRKKIVLTKRTYLLVAFVIITGLGVAGLILVYRKIEDWGGEYPPTVKCLDAFQSTMYALWVLSVITPISFVILKFRVTNLMVGFMYMFILVVCIFFSMKGISNAYYSYFQDTDLTIHQFYASTYNTRILNDFWDFYQKQQGCCGTKNIDIVDDWPGFLKTSRLPDSCCTDEWKIPVTFNSNDIYPYTLTANLLRKENKKMYYLSRGIAENYILNGIVHNKTCELVKKEHLENMKKKLDRDLNKRWRKYGKVAKWKNPDEGLGLFYLEFVHQVDFVCTIVGGSCIGCVIIIAVIFWQYYSRIKAEEYANLALPKEFEVLNLKRGSMIDDADIQRTVPKKKIKTNKVAPVSTPTAQMKGVVKGAVARRPGQQQLPPRKAPPKHHQAGGGGAVRPTGGPRQAAPPVNNSRAPGRLAQPGGPR